MSHRLSELPTISEDQFLRELCRGSEHQAPLTAPQVAGLANVGTDTFRRLTHFNLVPPKITVQEGVHSYDFAVIRLNNTQHFCMLLRSGEPLKELVFANRCVRS